MSALEDLLNAITTNPELRNSITAATSTEEAVRIAGDAGIQISADDLLSAFQSKMSELSAEELEAVSGGKVNPINSASTIGCGCGSPAGPKYTPILGD